MHWIVKRIEDERQMVVHETGADELIHSYPTRYLIDYRNNERQSQRHEEPIAVHSLLSRSELLIRLHALFFCYRSASWMNARWTFESKPSWPRSYWSCRYWRHWYTRSVSEALLQCSVRRKMQWRRDKKRSAASWNTNLSRFQWRSLKIAHLVD